MKKINKEFLGEMLFLIAISGIFLTLNLSNLKSWYFSAVGDEYAFFSMAQGIAKGENLPRIFSQRGVYDVIPVFSSYYQAFWMKILGINVFGWKASHVILVACTIPALYFLTKKLLNKTIALFTTSFYSSSHVIWAYTHTGYSNIESIFPFIFSLVMFAYDKYFLAGIFAGLAFYTYFISRITFVIILLWIWIYRKVLNIKKVLTQFFLGFSILVIPFFLVNRKVFFYDMFVRSVIAQNDPTYYGPKYKFIFDNLVRNGIAFWTNTKNMCYVSGSILDHLSGLLLIVGLLVLIKKSLCKDIPYMVIGIVSIVSFLTLAVFSPYGYVVISRQFFIIPSFAILAGIGIELIISLIKNLRIKTTFIFLTILCVFLLNCYRFFVQTPKILQLTPEALVMKELLSKKCSGKTNIIVGSLDHSPFPLLLPTLTAYGIEKQTILLEYNQLSEIDKYQASCIIRLL